MTVIFDAFIHIIHSKRKNEKTSEILHLAYHRK